MRKLTRNEIFAVIGILAVIVLVTWSEMSYAIRRSRDAQRRVDIGIITTALHTYQELAGFVPLSENGKIMACSNNEIEGRIEELVDSENFSKEEIKGLLVECEWGASPLVVFVKGENVTILENISSDPSRASGISYLYLSNGNRFQVYAHLEGKKDESGYGEHIVARDLMCGNKICNFGKAYGNTPLDRSIEEFEAQLLERQGK
jgi:type II secretory pathway pseudopilin PulG